MKILALTLSLLLSTTALAKISELSFTQEEQVLLDDLLKVQSKIIFRGERMIAGKFEEVTKETSKKTYMDGLRSRLGNMNGFSRF